MKKILALLSMSFISLAAHAAPATEESVNRLLNAMHAEKIIDTLMAQMEPMMKEIEHHAEEGKTLSADDQKIMDKYRTKTIAIMNENLSWEKLKPLYLHTYSEAFTQEEVDSLITFYESPAGQAVINKLPVVIQSTMKDVPKMMEPMFQEIQKASKEMSDELAAAHKQGAK
jgi:hypothetical protein